MSSAIKEKSEPSLLFVGIYAFMMAGFGVLIGFIYLMSFSSNAFSSAKERTEALEQRQSLDPIPGDAFYIEGSTLHSTTLRSTSWEPKRKQLIDGAAQTIKINANEINAWLDAKFRPASAQTGEEDKGLTFKPDQPNIGITEEGTIYLNLPTEISGYGLDGKYTFSAKVRYARTAPVRLVVDHLQIGGAAVPLPGILGDRIVSAMMKSYSGTEEYSIISEAWSKVRSIEASEGALVLSLDRPE